MNRSTLIVAGAILALALFGGGYTVGANSAPAKPATASSGAAMAAGAGGQAANRGQGGGAGLAGPVNGRIISVNADSITIAVNAPRAQGGAAGQPSASPVTTSSIALVGAATRVVRTTETDVKLSDLKAGDQVTIVGTTDPATGTISAQAVVIGGLNVLGQLFGGGQGGAPQGSAPRPSVSPR